ncbi:MAG: BlaI/MecI/CopY family transcriptional regulator [Lachnospiraceae bacterium]|jgi:predicted transcriptional regulator|nr:BlaI/MecI/CopY family transcriptional regulator [Lachnospiraceae bacterium]MCI9674956.1 BlaI/MecI/CopY family transcriptional regulator [Lachnospiraceae bacterium]
MTQMNPRELDVLNILWKSDEPMTSTDIVNEQKGLTQSTVIAVLRKLLKDELVEVSGVTHSGKVLSRTYRPTEASREIILENFQNDYRNFCNVIPKSTLCAAILEIDEDSAKAKDEVKKLKSMLADFEKRNRKPKEE